MSSLKKGLTNFFKGFGVYLVLLLLNTRSGEIYVNSIKNALDIFLMMMIMCSSTNVRRIGFLGVGLTTIITMLPLAAGLEILLLIGIIVLGVILIRSLPDIEDEDDQNEGEGSNRNRTADGSQPSNWMARSWLHPFDIYTFDPEHGLKIQKGFMERSIVHISTRDLMADIHQTACQRMFGFADISLHINFDGRPFGNQECELECIRYDAALMLCDLINR